MTENNIFEPDCNDCGENEYDYSRLNSRYEADVERDEIIEWNKDACNAQYRGLEMIAEQLNFKEMQLEGCRKGYEKLIGENKTLKEENKQLKQELFESKKDYIIETYSNNPIRRDKKLQVLKEEFKERFGDLTYITSDELLFNIINEAIENGDSK